MIISFPWPVFIVTVFVVTPHHQKMRPKAKNEKNKQNFTAASPDHR